MKRITLTLLALILALSCVFSIASCEMNENETPAATSEATTEASEATSEASTDGEKVEAKGLWKNATYLSDTTLGEGSKTVSFTVEAEGEMITITLKTDKATIGEAMYEHELINDASFFNVLNGMEASWEKDQAYWAFYNGDQYMMVGVGEASVEGEVNYRFVYTK